MDCKLSNVFLLMLVNTCYEEQDKQATMSQVKRSAESIGQHQDVKRQVLSPPEMAMPQYLLHSEADLLGMLQRTNQQMLSPIDMTFPRYLMTLKKEFEPRQDKRQGKTEKPSSNKGTMQQAMKNEMKIMKEKLLEEKTMDRLHWEKEMKHLKDHFLEEKEKDRLCWEQAMRKMMETFLAEKEKDRKCWIAQSNKLMYTEIQKIKYAKDDSQEIPVSHKKSYDASHGSASHETQVSHGGEATLKDYYTSCKKNPRHPQFVPFHDFNTDHLPKGIQDQEIVEFIKATADLTVRIDVKMTSTKRPECWPKSKFPYAFNDIKGSTDLRTGTGLVCMVEKWTEKYNKGTCKCRKCLHSHSPSKVWGVVRILSASELVFDEQEAKYTTCRLFYNREESHLVALGGWMVDDVNIEQGWIILKCVTCDLQVLDKLEKIWKHWRFNLWYKVNNKYKSSRETHKFTFIVSHPHGGPKKISVGHWIDKHEVSQGWSKYTYTTCTCPGSSGAYVHLMGYNDWNYIGGIVHSGVNSDGNNFSCAGVDFD